MAFGLWTERDDHIAQVKEIAFQAEDLEVSWDGERTLNKRDRERIINAANRLAKAMERIPDCPVPDDE